MLVVRYLGYETFYLKNPDPGIKYQIELSVSENMLDEVVLDASVFTREQMLEAFKQEFLGKTKAGRKSKILNENDIRFYYDKLEKSLFATSRNPIKVVNKVLGYEIEFDLIDFVSQYFTISLDEKDIRSNYFGGTSFFKDVSENKRGIKRKRIKAYIGSSRHLFKSLISGQFQDEKFQLYHKGFKVRASDFFNIEIEKRKVVASEVSGEKTYKKRNKITILGNNPDSPEAKIELLKKEYQKKVAVLYKRERSDITFKTRFFYVDDFGNHTHIDEILFSGEMSKDRLGEMLPINYEPYE